MSLQKRNHNSSVMSALRLNMCHTLSRQEKQILEGDEAIISIIKQLSMHSMRFQFNFEAGCRFTMQSRVINAMHAVGMNQACCFCAGF